jgi:hypothetical protein
MLDIGMDACGGCGVEIKVVGNLLLERSAKRLGNPDINIQETANNANLRQ